MERAAHIAEPPLSVHGDGLEEAVPYFLELRAQVRGRPEATALVDRCLQLLARAAVADSAGRVEIEADIDRLRWELEQRFGAHRAPVFH
jgi:hypothetical protein